MRLLNRKSDLSRFPTKWRRQQRWLSMMCGLFIVISESQQRPLGERPREELNPHRDSIACEPRGHGHRWKSDHRAQTSVVATTSNILNHLFRHNVGRNHARLVIE